MNEILEKNLNETEKKFFKTFRIEPKAKRVLRTFNVCPEYDTAIEYPLLDSDMLLKILCICNKHQVFYSGAEHGGYCLSSETPESLKDELLDACMQDKHRIFCDIREIFKDYISHSELPISMEEKFFKTFRIKPEAKADTTFPTQDTNYKVIIQYPKITPERLLEIMCITNRYMHKHLNSTNIKGLKDEILEDCINTFHNLPICHDSGDMLHDIFQIFQKG